MAFVRHFRKVKVRPPERPGVEPAPLMVDRAKQLYPSQNRTFLLGNAYQLPLPDSSFDAAFSVLVWHLLKDLEISANELSRVLARNGSFLLITANPGAYAAWKALYTDLKVTGKRLEGAMQLGTTVSHDVLFLHTLDEIKSSLQAAGLAVEEIETFRPLKQFEELKMFVSIKGKKAE